MLRIGSAKMKTRNGVCLQEFDQMAGPMRGLRCSLSWLKKGLYSVGIRGLFHWMICISGIGDSGFPGL